LADHAGLFRQSKFRQFLRGQNQQRTDGGIQPRPAGYPLASLRQAKLREFSPADALHVQLSDTYIRIRGSRREPKLSRIGTSSTTIRSFMIHLPTHRSRPSGSKMHVRPSRPSIATPNVRNGLHPEAGNRPFLPRSPVCCCAPLSPTTDPSPSSL
jgi:hypothetical protein